MTDPRELNAGNIVNIDCEPLSGVECRVSNTEVVNIGLTQTFAVTLVSDSDGAWSMTGTTNDKTATVSQLGGNKEQEIEWDDIEIQ